MTRDNKILPALCLIALCVVAPTLSQASADGETNSTSVTKMWFPDFSAVGEMFQFLQGLNGNTTIQEIMDVFSTGSADSNQFRVVKLLIPVLERVVPEESRNRSAEILARLENGEEIASHLIDAVYMMQQRMNSSETPESELRFFLEPLSYTLINVTQDVMKGNPDWPQYTNLEKMVEVAGKFTEINYVIQYLDILLTQYYNQGVDDLTKQDLRNFLDRLQQGQSVEDLLKTQIDSALSSGLHTLATSFNMSIPGGAPTKFPVLEKIKLYQIIDESLQQALLGVRADSNMTGAIWNMGEEEFVTDLTRLLLLTMNFDFPEVGNKLINESVILVDANLGEWAAKLGNASYTEPMLHSMANKMMMTMNVSDEFKSLVKKTLSLIAECLADSYEAHSQDSTWLTLDGSTQLMKVLTGTNTTMSNFMTKFIVTCIESLDEMASAEVKGNITTYMQLLAEGKRNETIEFEFNLWNMMIWNSTLAGQQGQRVRGLIQIITDEALSTVQVMRSDPMLAGALSMVGRTYSDLGSVEKLVYLLIDLDYESIWNNIEDKMMESLELMSSQLITKLKNGQSITEDLKASLMMIPFISTEQQEMMRSLFSDNRTQFVAEIFNEQMSSLYLNISASKPEWRLDNYTDTMRIWDLLSEFDPMKYGQSIGYVVIGRFRESPMMQRLNGLLQFVKNGGNLTESLESAKDLFVMTAFNNTEAAQMFKMIFDGKSLAPLYKEINTQLTALRQSGLFGMDEYNSLEGALQKVAVIFQSMNVSRFQAPLIESLMMAGQKAAASQIVSMLPPSAILMSETLMSLVEQNGDIPTYVIEQVQQALRNMSLVESLKGVNITLPDLPIGSYDEIQQFVTEQFLNSGIVKAGLTSMSNQLSAAYRTAKANMADSEWSQLSSAEKLYQTFVNLDVANLVMTVGAELMEAYNATMEYLSDPLNPGYMPNQCYSDIFETFSAMQSGNQAAMQMLDAWAKIPPGIFLARLTWVGDMNECEGVKFNRTFSKGVIEGGWGSAALNLSNTFLADLAKGLDQSGTGTGVTLNYGYCLPKSCDYTTSMTVISAMFRPTGASPTWLKRKADYPAVKEEWRQDSVFIGATSFFAFLAIVVWVCTTIDRALFYHDCSGDEKSAKSKMMANGGKMYKHEHLYPVVENGKAGHMNGGFIKDDEMETQNSFNAYEVDGTEGTEILPMKHTAPREMAMPEPKKREPGFGVKLIKAFSIYENLPPLLNTEVHPGQLQGLHGIRFLSMSWVILGHVYSFNANPFYAANLGGLAGWGAHGDWTFMGIVAGLFAVDSFFMLSGLLVGYLFLKMMEKAKGKPSVYQIVMYYVHRYIRLLPLYGGVILLFAAYARYMGLGPLHLWELNPEKEQCRAYWWTNLLYINNFYPESAIQQCVGWSWYLANDFQFYVVSPLLLVPLYFSRAVGYILLAVVWAAHVAVTAWLFSEGNGGTIFTDPTQFEKTYIKPYTRAGPYLIGLLLGYILFKKLKIQSAKVQFAWWVVAMGLFAICTYLPYDSTKDGLITGNGWDNAERAAFESLSRTAWAIALAWVIYACNNCCAGMVGDLLNWGGWAPLSKLTFAAYLIHPIIQIALLSNRFDLVYLEKWSLLYSDFGTLTFSYLVAVILYLVLEAPIASLEKLLLPKK